MFGELLRQQPNRLSGNRFLFGVLSPILLEMLIVESYFFLNPKTEFNPEALFLVGLSIFPFIFVYLFAPQGIFRASRAGKIYHKNLLQHIDEIFVAGADPQHLIGGKLLPEERLVIRDQIRRTLIPMLSKQFKRGYIDSFGTRQEYSTEGQLLSYAESLFLFSAFSAIFNILNTGVVIYLSRSSISLDFLYVDQISNPLNVWLFGSIFAAFTLTCLNLVRVSLSRIKELIPAVVPGVVFWEEEFTKESRLARMAALREFPLDKFLSRNAMQNFAFMKDVYTQTVFEPFLDTIRWYVRDRVGKAMTWRLYEEILDSLKISDVKKGIIEKAFFDVDMAAAEILAFDEKELRSIKFDIEFARSRLPASIWDSLSGEEKLTSFLFLYRSMETLFRNIIKEFSLPTEDTSFFGLLECLRTNEFLDTEEMRVLGRIRRKRNLILHKSGEKINIEAEDMSAFLILLENVLERVEQRLSHQRLEGRTKEKVTM